MFGWVELRKDTMFGWVEFRKDEKYKKENRVEK